MARMVKDPSAFPMSQLISTIRVSRTLSSTQRTTLDRASQPTLTIEGQSQVTKSGPGKALAPGALSQLPPPALTASWLPPPGRQPEAAGERSRAGAARWRPARGSGRGARAQREPRAGPGPLFDPRQLFSRKKQARLGLAAALRATLPSGGRAPRGEKAQQSFDHPQLLHSHLSRALTLDVDPALTFS